MKERSAMSLTRRELLKLGGAPGRSYMYRAPWMAVWPGVAISLAVFGFNMLGDALRDVLDPRLRGTGGAVR